MATTLLFTEVSLRQIAHGKTNSYKKNGFIFDTYYNGDRITS